METGAVVTCVVSPDEFHVQRSADTRRLEQLFLYVNSVASAARVPDGPVTGDVCTTAPVLDGPVTNDVHDDMCSRRAVTGDVYTSSL